MPAMPASRAVPKEMRSSIYWALLGLVIERPSYGFELFHRYQRMYGHVQPLSGESHVYTALDALEARLLVRQVRSGTARQPKPCYRATNAGQSGYEDWLVEQVVATRGREELWIRQFGVFADDPGAALNLLGRFQSEYLKRTGEAARSRVGTIESNADLVDALVVERQRLADGEMLTWLQRAQDGFEMRLSGGAVDESPSG